MPRISNIHNCWVIWLAEGKQIPHYTHVFIENLDGKLPANKCCAFCRIFSGDLFRLILGNLAENRIGFVSTFSCTSNNFSNRNALAHMCTNAARNWGLLRRCSWSFRTYFYNLQTDHTYVSENVCQKSYACPYVRVLPLETSSSSYFFYYTYSSFIFLFFSLDFFCISVSMLLYTNEFVI